MKKTYRKAGLVAGLTGSVYHHTIRHRLNTIIGLSFVRENN
jgi:hypothetical protein